MKAIILGHKIGKTSSVSYSNAQIRFTNFEPNRRYKFPPCRQLMLDFETGLWIATLEAGKGALNGPIIDYMKKGRKIP